MQCIHDHQLRVNLKILDNEASTDYKRVIKEKWKINYQLVPPNTHEINAAEQSMYTSPNPLTLTLTLTLTQP